MSIKKQDLYNFLTQKRRELYGEKVLPLENEIKLMKDKKINKILFKYEVIPTQDDKLYLERLYINLSNLRDNEISYSTFDINNLISNVRNLKTHEMLSNIVKNSYNFYKVPEIKQKENELSTLRKEIQTNFNNLEHMVKAQSTAKQGLKLLEELGFDVSKIKPTYKQEIMTLNINNSLLGLPENKGD